MRGRRPTTSPIRAVWGPDYVEGTIRELLAAEEAKATDLGTLLADEFFDGHCRLFHQMPFIFHVWDGLRGGFSALVNYHRLCEGNGAGRRLLASQHVALYALAEKLLTQALGEIAQLPSREVAAKIVALEERHRASRDTLWAKLGEAPLARALEPLARLAAATENFSWTLSTESAFHSFLGHRTLLRRP